MREQNHGIRIGCALIQVISFKQINLSERVSTFESKRKWHEKSQRYPFEWQLFYLNCHLISIKNDV